MNTRKVDIDKFRKLLTVVIGLAFVLALAAYGWRFSTADTRMKRFCGDIQTGWTVARLNAHAADHGYEPRTRADGTGLVVDPMRAQDFECGYQIVDGKVSSAAFHSRQLEPN